MLRVARVAMMAGNFTQRTNVALKRPTRTPIPSIAIEPSRIAFGDASCVMIKDAMITPMVMIEPTEISR